MNAVKVSNIFSTNNNLRQVSFGKSNIFLNQMLCVVLCFTFQSTQYVHIFMHECSRYVVSIVKLRCS